MAVPRACLLVYLLLLLLELHFSRLIETSSRTTSKIDRGRKAETSLRTMLDQLSHSKVVTLKEWIDSNFSSAAAGIASSITPYFATPQHNCKNLLIA